MEFTPYTIIREREITDEITDERTQVPSTGPL